MNQHDQIETILEAALAAVDPWAAVRRAVALAGDRLTVASETFDLSAIASICVLGAGKAGAPMVRALVDILGDRIDCGLVIVKHGHGEAVGRIGAVELVGGGHPIPDRAGQTATRRIVAMADDLGDSDLLIAPISGGASSLLSLPTAGLTLDDLIRTTAAMLECGADITEINAVRKHLSAVKGGQLARSAAPAMTIGLMLSDVVGDPLDAIGSGPTAPDSSTFMDARSIVEKYGIDPVLPAAVSERLCRGAVGELSDTAKPEDPLFYRVHNSVVAGGHTAAEAAVAAAQQQDLNAHLVTTTLNGEAREVGGQIATVARAVLDGHGPVERPCCLVHAGETTVRIRGTGKGGRNQELALAAAIGIDGLPGVFIACLATDGQDGPTDAAGAIVNGETLRRARDLGLDAVAALKNNDSYNFLGRVGDLLRTGPTLTNVADLILVMIF